MRHLNQLSAILIAVLLGASCADDGAPRGSSSGVSSATTTPAEAPVPGVADPSARSATEDRPAAQRHEIEVIPGPEGVSPDTPGVIRGVVRFDGTPPKRQEIKVSAAGCNHETGTVLKENLVVNDGLVQYAYVFVSGGLKDQEFPAPEEPVVLDQVGCMYTPHVVCIQTGQPLHVRNSDDTLHNVNWPDGNKMQPAGSAPLEITYERDSVGIMYRCDIHPWMSAFLCVAEHPYHQVTGFDGSFTLPEIAPGKYQVSLWTEKYKRDADKPSIEVPPGGEVVITFHISDKARGRRGRGR